jgi:hypothetical protein
VWQSVVAFFAFILFASLFGEYGIYTNRAVVGIAAVAFVFAAIVIKSPRLRLFPGRCGGHREVRAAPPRHHPARSGATRCRWAVAKSGERRGGHGRLIFITSVAPGALVPVTRRTCPHLAAVPPNGSA